MPQSSKVKGLSPDGRRPLIVPKTSELIPRDPPLKRDTQGDYASNLLSIDKIIQRLRETGQEDRFDSIMNDPNMRKVFEVISKDKKQGVFEIPPPEPEEDLK